MNIKNYKSMVFDCDGVILNSNKIKTYAFRVATSSYGAEATNELISYHLLNGGVSRYEKFDYFIKRILNIKFQKEKLLNKLLFDYNIITEDLLSKSELTYGLQELRNLSLDISWSIVSGGDEIELRKIFEKKRIDYLFDGGIYGSPDKKNDILTMQIDKGNIRLPALYLGDSKLDHQVSVANGLDFIFVSAWTEFKEYKEYCQKYNIKIIPKVYDLLLEF